MTIIKSVKAYLRVLTFLVVLSAALPAQAQIRSWDFTLTGDHPGNLGTVTGRLTFDQPGSHIQPISIELYSGHSDSFDQDLVLFTMTPANSTFTGDIILAPTVVAATYFHATFLDGAIERSFLIDFMPGALFHYSISDGITAPVSAGNGGLHAEEILSVPEPSSFVLLGLGLVAVAAASRLQRRKA